LEVTGIPAVFRRWELGIPEIIHKLFFTLKESVRNGKGNNNRQAPKQKQPQQEHHKEQQRTERNARNSRATTERNARNNSKERTTANPAAGGSSVFLIV
jgi:hypothetical protein